MIVFLFILGVHLVTVSMEEDARNPGIHSTAIALVQGIWAQHATAVSGRFTCKADRLKNAYFGSNVVIGFLKSPEWQLFIDMKDSGSCSRNKSRMLVSRFCSLTAMVSNKKNQLNLIFGII